MYKLGTITDNEQVPFSYPNVWAAERTSGPVRLVIGPTRGHIGLMRELATCWSPGYSLLYVLLVSRLGNEPGRYQCPDPLFLVELDGFLETYGTFLESDGRHHLWIGSLTNEGTLVYDRHNVIYAYGPLDSYRRILDRRGLGEVPEVRFPAPHTHEYNEQNDAWEDRLMNHWVWRKFPLQDNDDE